MTTSTKAFPSRKLVFRRPTKDNFIVSARELAYDVHSLDKDKSGEPYWRHLKGAADGVKVLGGSDAAIAAAYLHDTIEDHPTLVSPTKLIDWGFPADVVKIVVAMTKRSGQPQTDYLAQLIKAGDEACIVKLADLLHNTRRDRIQHLRDTGKGETADRLLLKYRPSIAALMLHLGMIVSEDEQTKLATKPKGSHTSWTSTSGSTKPQSFTASAMMTGDWPIGWTAPVAEFKRTGGGVDFVLADGTERTEAQGNKFLLYTRSGWTTRQHKDPLWSPAAEKQG